ncbi:hypothetical protein OG819_42380 [Streptomyces sp. NBC_01549]|uniref:hypothetical protein n=1 Tax=Streptomyces sp. NBC_01549 TaxID=2975874 RepID=UPI002254EA2F|nr:hypothetical protein [Streptomyces sp. NBC_01549]MCX4596063.1 hypothetical protein [Streptomyces sp. NBC_01549]
MTTRIPRNAKRVYYATETVVRDGSRFAGREQKSTTFREARTFLDELNAPGGVAVWNEGSRNGNHDAVARRHEDGSWTRLDRFTGNWEPME